MSEKKHVLIICHSAAGQMYLGVLLKRIWYAPLLVGTAEEGVRLARNTPYSLILLDGDIDGGLLQKAIALLKSEPSVRDVPLVVVLTRESAEANEAMLSQGCAAVLTKPLDLSILYGVLGRLSGQERNTPRVPVKMRVEIEERKPAAELTCLNISEGGMYLRTLLPLRDGAVLHVKFTLPRDTDFLNLAVRVVRTEQLGTQIETEPGMALCFFDQPEDAKVRIRNFVQWELMGDLEWEPRI